MKEEYHLFIIWENARTKERDIVNDIGEDFDILYKINVSWSKNLFSSNLTRFYGLNLPKDSNKEKHIGDGDFLVVIVKDSKPEYNHHETSNGRKYINSRTFLAKTKYRDLTGGGHKIHGTNTPREFTHDFMLLFGCNINEFIKNNNKKTIDFNGDVIGSSGWNNLEQLFHTLNDTDEYVVLRNFEDLPNNFKLSNQGDIDIISKNTEQTAFILNAQPVDLGGENVQYKVVVDGEVVLFDIYDLDNYRYDSTWKKDILSNRKLSNGVNIIGDSDQYLYSLLFHVLVFKPEIPSKYKSVLSSLNTEIASSDKNNKIGLLVQYMHNNNYHMPILRQDEYVNIENARAVNEMVSIEELKTIFKLDKVKLFKRSPIVEESLYYFATRGKQRLFIKSHKYSLKNEYELSKRMYKINKVNFVKPIGVHDGYTNYIVMEWCDGPTLDDFIKDGSIPVKYKSNLLVDICTIYNDLYRANITHRDIIPQNIIVTNGKLILIDFYFAVENDNYNEYQYVMNDITLIKSLGDAFAVRSYVWDDAYSLSKIIKLISGSSKGRIDKYARTIERNIGERVLTPKPEAFDNVIIKKEAVINDLQHELYLLKQKHSQSVKDSSVIIDNLNNIIKNIRLSKSYVLGRIITYPYRLVVKFKNSK